MAKGLTQNHIAYVLAGVGAMIIVAGVIAYFIPEAESLHSPVAHTPSLLWGYGSGLLASGLAIKVSKIRLLENPTC